MFSTSGGTFILVVAAFCMLVLKLRGAVRPVEFMAFARDTEQGSGSQKQEK